MSYCLNPSCLRPENPPHSNFCRSCGGRLRLRDRYLAIAPIGQGGFGRTFKAIDEDKPSKPFCVIKQFFPQMEGATAAQKAAELFTQEASALEQLDHPHIPKLLAYFITPDGRQYLVQEFIDGQNLSIELMQSGKFSIVQIQELLATILPTLDYIHTFGFIHRDIKPDNIIRRSDDRKLYLVDFGAAKITSKSGSQLSTTIGTPEFMAPEQGWGKAVPASDLYSLGVTCLNLLTGVSPFDLIDDLRGQWIWKSKLTSEIDPKLVTILDKLIEPKPIDRYATAQAVIADLHESPAVINSVAKTAVTQTNLPINSVTSVIPTTPILIPVLANNTNDNYHDWECSYTFEWHRKPINAIAISPYGEYLISGDDGGTVAIWNLNMSQQPIATYCNNNPIYAVAANPNLSQFASGDKNRRVQLRRRESIANSLQEYSHNGSVHSLQFSPDGKILASGGADRQIRLWNTETAKISCTFDGHQDAVLALKFMPNGKILISAGADRTIRFWDLDRKQLLKTIEAHDQAIQALAISQDGQIIVSGSSDHTVRVRQLGTSDSQIFQGHQGSVLAVSISPDRKTIASGSADGIVNIWDVDSHQLTHSFPAHQAAVKSIAFLPNGQALMTASLDRSIKIWRSAAIS
jgi:serine/threonine protein kinase